MCSSEERFCVINLQENKMPRTRGKTYCSQKGADEVDLEEEEQLENEEEEAASEVDENADEVDICQDWAAKPKLTTMYRTTTLGKTLVETLEELVSKNKLPSALSNIIMGQFDRRIMYTVKNKLLRESRIGFQPEQLKTYTYLNGVWTFILHGIEFRKRYSFLRIDQMKLVAVEKEGLPRRKKRWGSAKSGPAAPSKN